MKNYIYSAKKKAFYALSLKTSYEAAGSWPDDGVEVTDAIFLEYTASAPEGKMRSAGNDGLPAWADIPPESDEKLIARAESLRQQLLSQVDAITADWRTELALGDISDDDKARLSAYMAYKRELKAVDAVSAIAPGFTWPELPALQEPLIEAQGSADHRQSDV